jgi:hypothetical protein
MVKFLRVLTLHHLATCEVCAPCVQCNRSHDLSTFVIAALPLFPWKDMYSLCDTFRSPCWHILNKILDSIPISLLTWLAPTHTYLPLTIDAGRRCL